MERSIHGVYILFLICRFSEALDQFMKSKFMAGYKIVPGVLTWPTTSEVIEETRPERLQVRKSAAL